MVYNVHKVGLFLKHPFWIRDAIFRKITNRNQTNANEIATTETKYQTDCYSSEKMPIFNQILYRSYSRHRSNTKKIPKKLGQDYQIPIWYCYFLGIPNFWFPIDITIMDHPGRYVCRYVHCLLFIVHCSHIRPFHFTRNIQSTTRKGLFLGRRQRRY